MSSVADRNLLYGILALQLEFVSREQLIAAMNAWILEKETPLGQILLRRQSLSPEEHALLDALVATNLAKHGNTPAKSLSAVSSVESVRDELCALADSEVAASLAHISQRRPVAGADPLRTLAVGGLEFKGSGVVSWIVCDEGRRRV